MKNGKFIAFTKKIESKNMFFGNDEIKRVSLEWDLEEKEGMLTVIDLKTLDITQKKLKGKELKKWIESMEREVKYGYNVFEVMKGRIEDFKLIVEN